MLNILGTATNNDLKELQGLRHLSSQKILTAKILDYLASVLCRTQLENELSAVETYQL